MEIKSVKEYPPIIKRGWSDDFVCMTDYNHSIGRMHNGVWIDMNNKPIGNVILYCELPIVTEDMYEKENTL